MEEKYVVVTAISSHRLRYVVPMSKLQEMNTDYQADPKWALDAVVMQEVKEFSQSHIGEQISDMFVMGEEEILELFNQDNDYAESWSDEYKLAWIQHWEENPSDEKRKEFEKIRQNHFESKNSLSEAAWNDIYTHGMSTSGDKEYET